MSIALACPSVPVASRPPTMPPLSRAAFGSRFRWLLVDPDFEIACDALTEVENIAWGAYRAASRSERMPSTIADPSVEIRHRVVVVHDEEDRSYAEAVAGALSAARQALSAAGLEVDVFHASDDSRTPDACGRWSAAHGILMIAADPAMALRRAAVCGALQTTHDRGRRAYAFVTKDGGSAAVRSAAMRWLSGIGMIDAIEQSRLDHFLEADADAEADDAAPQPLSEGDPFVERIRYAARALAATLPAVRAGDRTPADPLLARASCGA